MPRKSARSAATTTQCHAIIYLWASVLAEQVWDPLSSSQTARLVAFIHRLRKGYPTVLHGDNRYTQVKLLFSSFEFDHFLNKNVQIRRSLLFPL